MATEGRFIPVDEPLELPDADPAPRLILGEIGDEVELSASNGWTRRVRIVGICDLRAGQREYRCKEL